MSPLFLLLLLLLFKGATTALSDIPVEVFVELLEDSELEDTLDELFPFVATVLCTMLAGAELVFC